ncbi:MAG: hypothetical protein PHV66_00270 [Bacteroidales bacterium]|nr:hypothetical protein [Bacteroidales bacterium]
MNAITDLFQNVAEFRKYVPGISANIEFSELNSSAISARKQIRNIITKELWDLIRDEVMPGSDASIYLSNAFGNLIMHKSLIFGVVSNRTNDKGDVYKHEYESMQRQYIDNYYNAMDSLIQELTESATYSAVWKATPNYKLISDLKIQTTQEFDSFYGIDLSYLFFFRTIPLQREILLDGLNDLFIRVETTPDLVSKLKMALTHLVVSLALSRFDIIELPATIRSLFNDQKTTRSGTDEQSRVLRLSAELRDNARSIIQAVEIAITEPDVDANLVTDTSFNKPDDRIYLIP